MATRSGKPKRVRDLFGAGDKGTTLRPEHTTAQVYAWFQNRHSRGITQIDDQGFYHSPDGEHSWKVPIGVRYAFGQPLIHGQIVHQYPWAVTWRSPKTHKRYRKHFMQLISAIDFVATRAQYVDKNAAVYSRAVGYDIIPSLRGKIPKPWYWCPRCITARKFYPQGDRTFSTVKKFGTSDGHYSWKEVKLRLLRCRVCGCTNQDHRFRRSNQPWQVRKFKRGVTRAKRKRR